MNSLSGASRCYSLNYRDLVMLKRGFCVGAAVTIPEVNVLSNILMCLKWVNWENRVSIES